ncbi:MAG TPA: ATP-binding cassette domain-containing protein [Gaiellaceae bacterium]|nr:ATP-binding cassette domain-containing protein [Gaiellaceae bacterium]
MIEVDELRKVYPGGVEAVKGIGFEVAPGEVFGLLGPNGAGKSTTIGMLTTTVRPTSGTARLAGYDVGEQPLAARSVSSVVFQDSVVDRSLSGRRNLDLHARLWRVEAAAAKERIDELVEAVGLGDLVDRPVATYSGGERRRLEIARSLVSGPRVLFLDEPTVGLDPLIRAELLDLIAELRDRSELTILLTTHYLDEAERLCGRVAIMHAGEIVALDTPERLRAGLGRELLELRVDGDATVALASLRSRGIAHETAFTVGSTLTVPLNGHSTSEAIAAVHELGIAGAVSARRPTLDEVYLRLTGGRLAEAA